MDPLSIVAVGVLLLSAGLIHLVNRHIKAGRIGVNAAIGIRTRDTMVNEVTWRAGHQAALPILNWLSLTFLITAIVAAGIFVYAKAQPTALPTPMFESLFAVVILCGCLLAFVFVILAARKANQAARAVLTED